MFALKKTTHKFRGIKDKERLLREIHVARQLKEHPNLVQ